jgi:hypothetical protein
MVTSVSSFLVSLAVVSFVAVQPATDESRINVDKTTLAFFMIIILLEY